MRQGLLRAVLWVTGVLACLAGPAVLFPEAWLRTVCGWFVGAQTVQTLWPDGPLFVYIARVGLVLTLWIGGVLVACARDPERHKGLVDFAAVMFLVLGGVCVIVGLQSDVPARWWLWDAGPALAAGVLLLLCRPGGEPPAVTTAAEEKSAGPAPAQRDRPEQSGQA